MKKIKIIGFIASIFAFSACSLKANLVSVSKFKELYQNHLETKRIGDLGSEDVSVILTEGKRTGIQEIDSELKPGTKYLTSHLDQDVYTINIPKRSDLTIEHFKEVSHLELQVTDENRQFNFIEKDDGIGHILHQDDNYDGNRTKLVVSISVTVEEGDKYYIEALSTKTEYKWCEKEYRKEPLPDQEIGDLIKSVRDIADESIFEGLFGNTDEAKKKNNEEMAKFIKVEELSKVEKALISDETVRNQVNALIDAFYARTETISAHDTLKGYVDRVLDNIKNTIDLPNDDTHKIEIMEKSNNYVYRSLHDSLTTETKVNQVDETYVISSYIEKDSTKPTDFLSVEFM